MPPTPHEIPIELKRSFSTPATTPSSFVDEEKCLVPQTVRLSAPKRAIGWKHIPIAILAASLLEIIAYAACDDKAQKWLRFEPTKTHQLWRFFTYMLLHEDCFHLSLNLTMQLLFAHCLELRHGPLRIFCLYLLGGVTGVLGASCLHPDLVIGASGGVYALLIAHAADILMDFDRIRHKIYRSVCIFIIVISDLLVYNIIRIFSKDEPLISWGAHVFGGITGFCIGLIMFYRKGADFGGGGRRLVLFWVGVGVYALLVVVLIGLRMQIRKCTPAGLMRSRYIYFC